MNYSITKITIKYHRISKIKTEFKLKEPYAGCDENEIKREFSEHVIIDSESETLEICCEFGRGNKVNSIYNIDKDEIYDFFDTYNGETLFVEMTGDSSQIEQDPSDIKRYEIIVEFENASPRTISGIFDGNGLPDDYASFMDSLAEFISRYEFGGDLFNKRIYKARKKGRGECIFCSVEFENAYKSYYYLTDDESLAVGDFVVVPVGKNNKEAIAHIVKIEYFNTDEVPIPFNRVKSIIRRADEEKDYFQKEWFY